MCNIFAIKQQNIGHTTKGMSYLHLLVTFHPGQNNIFFKGPVVHTVLLPKSHNVLGFNNHLSGNKTLQTELKYSYPSLRYCIFCTSGTNPISEQFTKKMF